MSEVSAVFRMVDASNFGGKVGELVRVGISHAQLDREMGLGLDTTAKVATTFTKQEHGLAHLLDVPVEWVQGLA